MMMLNRQKLGRMKRNVCMTGSFPRNNIYHVYIKICSKSSENFSLKKKNFETFNKVKTSNLLMYILN